MWLVILISGLSLFHHGAYVHAFLAPMPGPRPADGSSSVARPSKERGYSMIKASNINDDEYDVVVIGAGIGEFCTMLLFSSFLCFTSQSHLTHSLRRRAVLRSTLRQVRAQDIVS